MAMITHYRSHLVLIMTVAYFVALNAQRINTLHPQIKKKIDPLLQHTIALKERFPRQPLKIIESYNADTRVSIITGDFVGVLIQSPSEMREYVKSIGGIVGSVHGTIYTALIPVQSIGKVALQKTVKYVEASRWLFPSLDLSRVKTEADVLHAFPDASRRLTGKGIVIGFTDTGINTDHPNFKLPDGRTRILYVWDQYSSSGGLPPEEFSYGIEKDSAAINGDKWSMIDFFGHGTHVCGIAAGNGMPSKQYTGMAPEADIIMVSNYGDDLFNRGSTTVGTLDGYDYIRTKARELGKRFVINTSQGTNLGPHDGTTLFEQAINADVAQESIICLAAGNEADNARHASAVVAIASPQEIECCLASDTSYFIPMDIWYSRNDRLVLRIKESSDIAYTSLFPAVDSTITHSFNSVTVTVTTNIGSILNGDNEIYITFKPKTSSSFRMKLEFSAEPGNTLPDGGRVDLWWERNFAVSFIDHIDKSITLDMPACADSAISVTSYNNRSSSYGLVDDISTFSSRGPRRDGKMKPDIAGIGGMVVSSVNSGGYDIFSGTSMASPHVAGAVALLLQQDTTLTSYQVKKNLLTTATEDIFTGAVPNPIWGYGKLNALKAAGYDEISIIDISTDTLRFNSAYIGLVSDDSVLIQNLGNKALTISNVTTSNPIFSVNKSSFTVPPRSIEQLIVRVTPSAPGDFTGVVTITSDDTSHPATPLVILGHSDYPPSASFSPDSFSYKIDRGDSIQTTLTLSNSGGGQLRYRIFINYSIPGSTSPAQEGTLTTARWNGNSQLFPLSSRHLPLTYTTSSPLPLIADDPIGDATNVDIAEIRGHISGGIMTLQIKTATTLSPTNFVGYLGLDIDRNKTTGIPLPFGLLTHEVGCEFFAQFLDITSNGIQLRDPEWNSVDRYAPIIDTAGNSLTFSVPLGSIRSDGKPINIASVFGTYTGPTDYAPDMGYCTLGSSWLSSIPDGGEIAPGCSTNVSIYIRSDDIYDKELFAAIMITTNDPNNQIIKIPVRLTVTSIITTVSDEEINAPKVFTLHQNYPNPFNPFTTIKYEIPKTSHVDLTIHNILGEKIMTLVNENQTAGVYTVQWDHRSNYGTTASGIYFTVFRAGDFREVIKMILMK